jgi:5-methyltetrahydrofolate--homocysteine methyltransferase
VATDNPVPEPPFLGSRVVAPVWLDEIVGYVNEQELFRSAWELQPAEGEDERAWLRRCREVLVRRLSTARSQELLTPQVAYGFFPVNSDGRELIVWTDDDRVDERMRLEFPRQRRAPYLCVADYFKPVGTSDYAALQMVTLGSKVSTRLLQRYPGESREELTALRGLAGELLVGFAEYWHRRVRIDWGFDDEDGPTLGLMRTGFYRGHRYPVGPTNHYRVAELLGAGELGVTILNDDSIAPEFTAMSLVAHHPGATGFAV